MYPTPIHLQPAYKKANALALPLQNTEKVAKNILCLPIYPEMTDKHVNCICNLFPNFFFIAIACTIFALILIRIFFTEGWPCFILFLKEKSNLTFSSYALILNLKKY